jgi:hypothetical protein
MHALEVAQKLPHKPVYRVKDVASICPSISTAYRKLEELEKIGIIERPKRGYFMLKECATQPISVIESLLPSLKALKEGRTFGKYYNETDVRIARKLLDSLDGFVTLDYKAYELTGIQTPATLYVYVNSINDAAKVLKGNGFSEGTKGPVVLLPRYGDFTNAIQRVYLDCIAKGGRNTIDAVAIAIQYPDELNIKGSFTVDLIEKVREELPSVIHEPITA